MRERGRGRRAITVAVVALAIAVCAPELVTSAGAATTRNTSRIQLHELTRSTAKHRKPHRKLKRISSAKKHTILVRYIRKHPGIIAAHERRPNVTLAVKLRARAAARARARVHKPRRTVRHKKAPAHPAARKGKKKRKNKSSSGTSKKRLAILFGGLVVGGLAVFLIASSVLGGPRSRARARARRRQRAYAPR